VEQQVLQPRAADDSEQDGAGREFAETAEEAILNLERAASVHALRADGRFNFKTLKHDLAVEGLDNISRSYSRLSIGSCMRHHAQRAVNIRRSKPQPSIGPSLLHHGIAICDDEQPESQEAGDGFASRFNRYLLAARTTDVGQGFGSECKQRARAIHGHLHALDCVAPLLPPPHAAVVARSLNHLRPHLFATGHCRSECKEESSDASAPDMLYVCVSTMAQINPHLMLRFTCRFSDLSRQLKDDRDDLFARLTQAQQDNKIMNQELSTARSNLAVVKDELEFAKRAVKTLQSSKATSKEALCAALPALLFSSTLSPQCDLFLHLLLSQLLQGLCSRCAESRVVGGGEDREERGARSPG
jgi:hypothetical protein